MAGDSMPTTIEAKAGRLLADGRVFIRWSTPELVAAVVRGDTGIYDVRLERGRWSCPCPARQTCSHLEAVMRVTVPEVAPTPNLDELLGPQRPIDYSNEPF